MDSWLFYFSDYNLIVSLFILLYNVFFVHWKLFQVGSSALLTGAQVTPIPHVFHLLLWHYKMIQAHFVFSLLSPRSAISPEKSSSFYLETKIWVVDVLVAAGVSLLLGPLSGQIWEIHVVY